MNGVITITDFSKVNNSYILEPNLLIRSRKENSSMLQTKEYLFHLYGKLPKEADPGL